MIKIQITKCKNPYSWYYKKVGESFYVYDTDDNEDYYILDDMLKIDKNDADDIYKLRHKKLESLIK